MGRRKIEIPKDRLWELYIGQKMSTTEICKLFDCQRQTIIRRLKEYGIPVRDKAEVGLLKKGVSIPCDELRDLYERQGLSSIKIAEIYGCSDVIVRKKLKQCGISIRPPSEAAVLRWNVDIPEDELKDLYEVRALSTIAISEIYGCTPRTVLNKMAEYGIEPRTISEAMALVEGYPKADFSGNLAEKAYLLGFRLGDLSVRMVQEAGHTILVECSTTKQEQIELIRELFQRYGHVHVSGPDKRGVFGVRCYLNMAFDFLLPKEDRIEEWILEEPERYFAPFFAGYVDAEGHIGVDGGQANFQVRSCDKNILQQSYAVLTSLGIDFSKPRIIMKKGYTSKRGVTLRRDFWGLGTARKTSLLKLFDLLEPYLKHAKRRRDMELARANIEERNAREQA